jgi:hypothetical protein
MLQQRLQALTAALAGGTMVVLSACTAAEGGAPSDSGFTDITDQVGSWDMCKVLSPEPIFEQVSGSGYVDGMEPRHIGLGSARNAEAISCAAAIESPTVDGADTVDVDVTLSVFPGVSTEHVDDMWELRQGGWYEENVEGGALGLSEQDLVIDRDLQGDWDRGHAYAMFGTTGATSGDGGQLLVNVRTENHMLEVHVFLPTDIEKSVTASYGLSQEEIDAKTSLTFDRVEFADWVVDEHIHAMFEAVSEALEH